ncbi:ATP-dependent helicase [Paenibacillus polysaccharolyticus]|uniref:ATP-dependent helicase n=1 Tax=Paenibacillus polysaccharolyticus TaxID=582692 RepID=UPI002040402A|nr:ATP-dependent helicase [Paenibacillus polysaccharolyticus]MCM3133450.1 ATP-dependent helicase [Paenibacillus polysaccharolyticus]
MNFSLTETQKKIVNHFDGAIMVTAGPGSGKTRVLTERIINLLNQNQKRILTLTFSNKAAEEIRERVESRIINDEMRQQVYIGTIHSFCLEVVLNRGNLIGLPSNMVIFESESDRISILKKIFNDYPELGEQISDLFDKDRNIYKQCLRQISIYKSKFILPEVLLDSNKKFDLTFSKLYEAYNNLMMAQRALDIDDILFYAFRIFTERPQIANTYTRLYKHIFIDEAQDLNIAQYKVIRALATGFSNVMMVGDPAQSIYGFNGSESELMMKSFREDFNPIEYQLIENFRSTKKIVEAAKKIQANSNSSAVYPLEGVFSVRSFENEKLEAKWVVNKIESMLEHGSAWVEGVLKSENIAVIARNKYLLSSISGILEQKNIPYNLGHSSRSVESESNAIKIFEAGIRVIINPFDNVHFSQILNLLNYKGVIEESSENNFYLNLLLNIDLSKLEPEYEKLYLAIKESWEILLNNEENFTKAIDVLTTKLVNKEMNNISTNEEIETEQFFIQKDLEMWKNNWKNYCNQSVSGQRNLAHFRNLVSIGKTYSFNKSGISLLTVHGSKGLEYDVVFLIGITEGVFPDYRAKGEKEKREEVNNMFVAITRAKRECYITFPLSRKMPWGDFKPQKASRFIELIEL